MVIDLGNINSLLAGSFAKDSSLGLASGKMGGCIYFYCLSRARNDSGYRKTAEKLLDDVFAGIASVRSIDVKNGLGGIRLGISHLINHNYVKGNPHEILKDVDDTIFRHLCYPRYNKELDSLALIQSLFYLYVRLTEASKNREEEYLLWGLMRQTINLTFERAAANPRFFVEPLSYNVEYQLPLFLFAIGHIGRHGLYKDRIQKILEELSPVILSTVPVLHSNKLFLWAAMQPITETFAIEGWPAHLALLRRETAIDAIFNRELKNRNIFFNNGVGSIAYLLNTVKDLIDQQDMGSYRQQAMQAIESSDVWTIYNQPGYIGQYKGLYDGIPGAILTRMAIKNTKE